jgi:hypothetical protein
MFPDAKFIKIGLGVGGIPFFCGEALQNGKQIRQCFGFRGNDIVVYPGTIKEVHRVVPDGSIEYEIIK